MSGPKDLAPPKRYSMQVFKGSLNTVFSLQSKLGALFEELKCLDLTDKHLGIQFDCKQEVKKLSLIILKIQNPLVFDYKGKFGDSTRIRIQNEIDNRMSELKQTIKECQNVKTIFNEKVSDYKAYRSYLDIQIASKKDLVQFKDQVVDNLTNNISSVEPELFKESKKKIENISYTLSTTPFRFGFLSIANAEKTGILEHILEKEREINRTRAEISDKVYEKIHQSGNSKVQIVKQELPDKSRIVSDKIRAIIRNCEDITVREEYKKMLKNLTESHSLKDIFYFRELHDSILDMEKQRKIKEKIAELIAEMNTYSTHESLHQEKQDLFQILISLLHRKNIQTIDFEDVRQRLIDLKKSSEHLISEEEIQRKERLFLKSQILLNLENKGYEVIDDLEVIDFEKENDFLLRIKDQNNFLNLKFKEDGSLRYVFQIPENIDELGTDRRNSKLYEMGVTCADFNSIVDDLSKMGLKMEVRSEKNVELESIVTVTKKQKEKIKERSKGTQQKQIKKKYLNQ